MVKIVRCQVATINQITAVGGGLLKEVSPQFFPFTIDMKTTFIHSYYLSSDVRTQHTIRRASVKLGIYENGNGASSLLRSESSY